MASPSRTAIRLAALVMAAALIGWQYVGAHRSAHGAPLAGATKPPPATAAPAASAPSWRLGQLTLHACELDQPNSALSSAAWCAAVRVPENRADPHSRMITLKVALIRSSAQVASKDVVAFLAGGPGQAATENWPAVAPALQPLLAHRHVLLVDQRGTGGSHPLSCQPDEDAPEQADEPAAMRAQAQACLKQIEAQADPRYYTTTDAVADLEQVRQLLGAPTLDLIGVSYGTRLAQQYVMRHPEAVRAMVLDGVVPNALVLGEDFAANLDQALKAQFDRCRADAQCAKRFGDPYQTLFQLRDALRANPHKVSFRDPQSYQSVRRVLDDSSLVSVVRVFAYNPITAALLPLSIDNAAHGDVGPLLGQAKLLSGDLADTLNSAMQYSVICSEDADLLKPRPQDAQTLLGNRMIETFQAICPVWPKGARPVDFHQPLRSAVPSLLLSGQYDPVTPPRYAQEVAQGLSNARVLVLAGQAHNVIAAGCTPRLLKDFIEQLDPRALDAGCLERLRPTPMFIDFNGAAP
jgi:pimeloyl-ACP methyl ester carboxylesterase